MPRKAFLAGGELAHEFYVAAQLGMTVARLRREMSNLEFMQWTRYFAWVRQSEDLANKQAAARSGG